MKLSFVGYLNLSLPDFTERVIATLPDGAVIPANLTTSQASVSNGDTFLLVSSADSEQVRKILYFKADDFAGRNYNGQVFAEIVAERGAASIRGISYSKLGLVVTLYNEPKPLLLLIEGPFEPSAAKLYRLQ